jgi:hypothetical protein
MPRTSAWGVSGGGRVRRALVLAFAAAACAEPLSLETFEARVLAAEGWAGNDIAITSPGFGATWLLPSAWLDDEPLAVHRIDDTTVAATLPPVSGSHTLTVRGIRIEPLVVPLTVYGYAGFDDGYPFIIGDVLVWPRTGHASVLGVSSGGLASIDLDTRVVTVFDSVFDPARCWGGLRGPGVTPRDSVFVVLPIGSPSVESWRIGPTPVRLDVHPEHGIPRQLMQLGDDVWLRGGAHSLAIRWRTDSMQPYQEIGYLVEETEGVHLSPRKDRATVRVDHAADGLPVFDVPSGDLAYRVDDLKVAAGVDFSADGELLAVVGGTTWFESPTGRVVLLEASTGRVLQDTTLDLHVFAVAIDPVRPWLYVGATDPDSSRREADDRLLRFRPILVVLERSTFRVIATLRGGPDAPWGCHYQCYKGVIALSDAPFAYVVWGWDPPATIAWRFALPPPGT